MISLIVIGYLVIGFITVSLTMKFDKELNLTFDDFAFGIFLWPLWVIGYIAIIFAIILKLWYDFLIKEQTKDD